MKLFGTRTNILGCSGWNMSDRSLVAPIALGIALTGWLPFNNATRNLEMYRKQVAGHMLRSLVYWRHWFRSDWGLSLLASEEGWRVVWWKISRHFKTCCLGGLYMQHIFISCWKYFIKCPNGQIDCSMQVKIPKDSVGIVIGRQGANIREIQVETLYPLIWNPRLKFVTGQDWDQDQLQRWAWDRGVQGGCNQVG